VDFRSLVLQVPHIPATHIAQTRPCNNVERNQWVWVSHEALQATLDLSTQDLKVIDGVSLKVQLWRPSLNALRKAREDGVLPARDPCTKP
jgi:hypothetical protein